MTNAIDQRKTLKLTRRAGRTLAALVLAVTTANLATAAEFIPLGTLPGYSLSSGWAYARGISDDGVYVAGEAYGGSLALQQPFRWSQQTGTIGVGIYGSAGGPGSQIISGDGTTIVGEAFGSTGESEVFVYSTATAYLNLAANTARAQGVSSNGDVVVGYVRTVRGREPALWDDVAFRWTQSDGVQLLGLLPGYPLSHVSDISPNGQFIAGVGLTPFGQVGQLKEYFLWNQDSGIVGTGIITPDPYSGASISDDGKILAGSTAIMTENEQAFFWTDESGIVGLGWLGGGTTNDTYSRVRDMTPDGRVIAGHSGGGSFGNRAFVWTEATGMQDFMAVIASDHGLADALVGWQLTSIQALTPNAQFFVGLGTNPAGRTESWLVRLDAPWGTQPIPEPTAAAIALLALVPLALWRTRRAGRVLALLVLSATFANLATAAEFIPLGTLPGFETSLAFGVSDDGGVVAGTAYNVDPADGLSHFEAFRWTDASGIRGLGKLPGAERSYASESPLSGDGSTVVGYSYDEHAFYSTTAALFDSRSRPRSFDANQDNSVSQGVAVSRDGAILLGRVRYLTNNGESDLVEPYIWTADNGAHLLGHPRTTQTATEATDLSPDGTVVVGRSRRSIHDSSNNPVDVGDWELFRWTESGGMEPLGIEVASGPVKVSLDGAMIAGTIPSSSATDVLNAFLWTETTGVQSLGSLPSAPMGDSSVQDMSPDGRFIVGSSGGRAFVWTPDGGMEDFMQVLQSQYDLSDALQGWELTTIQAVSANGQFFTGFSKKSTGYHEAWLVRLDAPWGTTAIPEPTTAALALLALAPLAVRRTRCVPQ